MCKTVYTLRIHFIYGWVNITFFFIILYWALHDSDSCTLYVYTEEITITIVWRYVFFPKWVHINNMKYRQTLKSPFVFFFVFRSIYVRSQFLDAEILSWHAQACMHACMRSCGWKSSCERNWRHLFDNKFVFHIWLNHFISVDLLASEFSIIQIEWHGQNFQWNPSICVCIGRYIYYIVSHALGHCKYLLHPVQCTLWNADIFGVLLCFNGIQCSKEIVFDLVDGRYLRLIETRIDEFFSV